MNTEPAFTASQRLDKATRAAGNWQQAPQAAAIAAACPNVKPILKPRLQIG